MRAFSRWTAGSRGVGAVAFGIGSETKRSPGELVQPASRTASAAAMPSARVTLIVDCPPMTHRRFHYRTAALLHPASHPDPAAFQFLRVDVRRREISPMTLEDGDREVLRQPPPEIDIYSGAVLPH